jgi:ribosomal protein S12 methylthiotransferase
MDGKLDDDEIRARVEHVTDLVEQLTSQRAEDRVGDDVVVLVESVTDGVAEGRADHQGPEVDGTTRLTGDGRGDHAVGDLVPAVVVASEGADLVASPIGASGAGS